MKYLPILFSLCILVSCKKAPVDDLNYIVTVEKSSSQSATVEINDDVYKHQDGTFQQSHIHADEYGVLSVTASYDNSEQSEFTIDISTEDGVSVANTTDRGYTYIVYSKLSGAQYSNSSGGSGSGGASYHLCGHPTKDGTPCKRHVAGSGTEYCWQHR